MDTFIVIAAIILGVVGILGAILPGIPGTPLSFVGLLLLVFVPECNYTADFLITMGAIAAVITVLDYIIPIYGTKKFGGTKMGVRGSTIGLIVGVFILPLLGGPLAIGGIILGPFIGAYIGEVMAHNEKNAFRSALGSFLGFLAGTLIKVIYAIVVMVFVTKDGLQLLF